MFSFILFIVFAWIIYWIGEQRWNKGIIGAIIIIIGTTWFYNYLDFPSWKEITENRIHQVPMTNFLNQESFVTKDIYIKYRWRLNLSSKYFTGWITDDVKINEIQYDPKQWYMIISIQWTYYHYCRVPRDSWYPFYISADKNNYYERNFYGKFDCRKWGIWDYPWSFVVDLDSNKYNNNVKWYNDHDEWDDIWYDCDVCDDCSASDDEDQCSSDCNDNC